MTVWTRWSTFIRAEDDVVWIGGNRILGCSLLVRVLGPTRKVGARVGVVAVVFVVLCVSIGGLWV